MTLTGPLREAKKTLNIPLDQARVVKGNTTNTTEPYGREDVSEGDK